MYYPKTISIWKYIDSFLVSENDWANQSVPAHVWGRNTEMKKNDQGVFHCASIQLVSWSDEHTAPLIIAQAKLTMESGQLMWVPFLKHWFLCTFFSLLLENG